LEKQSENQKESCTNNVTSLAANFRRYNSKAILPFQQLERFLDEEWLCLLTFKNSHVIFSLMLGTWTLHEFLILTRSEVLLLVQFDKPVDHFWKINEP